MTDNQVTKSLRIVIADDEDDFRQFLGRGLTQLGYTIVGEAQTGCELVRCCREAVPDLVITDIDMPKMNGIQAVAEIRRQQAIPVIVISSHDPPKSAEHLEVHYLVKPVCLGDLDTLIARIFQAVID